MTLRHLRIFVAICETGSATAAGEMLYLAQPSISLALSELESHYGVKLFDRIGRRLQITQAGQFFLPRAIQIVNLFDTITQEMSSLDFKGTLRVGASVTIGTYLLPAALVAFREQFPDMEVIVSIAHSGKIEQDVLENNIDLGLVETNIQNESLCQQPIARDHILWICAPDHPFANSKNVSFEKVVTQPILLWEAKSRRRSLLESIFREKGYILNPTWQSISAQAILSAVISGMGISFLSRTLVSGALDRGEISSFRVDNMDFYRNFSVIRNKNKTVSHSMNVLIDLCRAQAESKCLAVSFDF
ncbi:LysR family transcriptional regulator [Agathobaculum sp. NTUH-O15-33]|uniref:LysR family transcriptional regulator n=1 Tax=Agathobaculum sp. NTUH-O15-33 TaxID=3079302 RepID=UPI002958C521|nr:LysR family transcriptional regulator [Agathobaculum sp. NTUH-O15-33]WNX85093.1 LysR family transcriptional regulator [Agathobaculum sp. NTUH-O15-33]